MKKGENPPVRLILCVEKGTAEARDALDNLPNKVLAAEYHLNQPLAWGDSFLMYESGTGTRNVHLIHSSLLIIRIVSQRGRMRVFLIPGLLIFPWLYFYAATRKSISKRIVGNTEDSQGVPASIPSTQSARLNASPRYPGDILAASATDARDVARSVL